MLGPLSDFVSVASVIQLSSAGGGRQGLSIKPRGKKNKHVTVLQTHAVHTAELFNLHSIMHKNNVISLY